MSYVNVYRCKGEWCYACFRDGEFDSSDVLGIPDEYGEQEAIEEATLQFPGYAVCRVSDVNE